MTAPLYCMMAALIVALVVAPTGAGAGEEVRGLWVVRNSIADAAGVAAVVDFAASHHYNVLFVQVRGRGDAWYRSDFVPGPEGHPDIPAQFDPLAAVIERAHARGIEVHAWFNMYLAASLESLPGDPGHPLNAHPEWFMVDENGLNMAAAPAGSLETRGAEGRFLSPGLEKVRDYLSRVITEVLATYDIDGVHLDYIRYPGRNYDFSAMMRDGFRKSAGADPREVMFGPPEADPSLELLGKWVDFRVAQVDSQVLAIRRRIDLIDPRIRLSAAVKPHADDAYYQYGQNWVGWLADGTVDFVVTMSYFPENGDFEDVLGASLAKTDRRRVIAGIGGYRLTPEKAAEQVDISRSLGCLGFCMFSYSTFADDPSFAARFQERAVVTDGSPPAEFHPYLRETR